MIRNNTLVPSTIHSFIKKLSIDFLFGSPNQKEKIKYEEMNFLSMNKNVHQILETIQTALRSCQVINTNDQITFFIEELDLSNKQINPKILNVICNFLLKKEIILLSLSLSGNVFGSKIDPLIKYLEGTTKLTKLNLSNNKLGQIAFNKLKYVLCNQNTTLEEINLNATNLGSSSLILLCGILSRNHQLKKLEAIDNFNFVDPKILQHLFQLIKKNKTILQINIFKKMQLDEESQILWDKIENILQLNLMSFKENNRLLSDKVLDCDNEKPKKLKLLNKNHQREKNTIESKTRVDSQTNLNNTKRIKSGNENKRKKDQKKKSKNKTVKKTKTNKKTKNKAKKKKKAKEKEKEASFNKCKNKKKKRESAQIKTKKKPNKRRFWFMKKKKQTNNNICLDKNSKQKETKKNKSRVKSDLTSSSSSELSDDSFLGFVLVEKNNIFIEEWERVNFDIDSDDYNDFEQQYNKNVNRMLKSNSKFKKIYKDSGLK
ncbi:nacht lrr and pyd domains-containing protein [Anaeramoeba flamelloides]|uniref:Nacht lrr and pyd domains-containing protein n=1 Tax=Anaeramoeba flamelloides TaxID=1746091 RepID=A0AAV7YJT8_9EUKA|nr:nacht lrr and pyd domains-containing protein [Anaeramoeba flamelloides]